ncbi:hypothetical protein JNB63_02030 [Microbacterium trichothecenolyticum]|uniref:hypothetical protein n=1 Tax=Microbacterium trichothecenolyticum TaxID=69370 RepID=UPI001C6E3A06|nr:hypothetical protein [Microbacterium trichothecenolyticum]MBW9118864.1 hypothetical protein [Microbacterium trichothecenolyticum]
MPAPTALEVSGFAHPEPDLWILQFSWPTNPIPANGSYGSWQAHHRAVKAAKNQCLRMAIAAKLPEMAKCEAKLTQWFVLNRRRDVDNLARLEKPLFDALVLAGVVRDDTPDLMVKPRAEIRHVNDSHGLVTKPGFTLHVRQLERVEEFEL